jgi:putative glycosyltransferase
MDLSIVTTLYYAAPYLQEFCTRIQKQAEGITPDYEIILVNDGSPDESLDIAVSLHEQNAKIQVVDLSRNFGHHKAIMTGISYASGQLVFVTECDLEVNPEYLTVFYDKILETGSDVVFGVQQTRHGPFLRRSAGRMFYKLFNWLTSDPLPKNLINVRLMSRRYVDALLEHREREVFIGGLWVSTGFHQVPLVVDKPYKGSSTYNLGRQIAMVVNAITSFSNKPLVYIFYLGIAIFAVAGIAALALVIRRLVFGALLEGWPSLIVSIWLLGGLNVLCLGIIGVYLSKVFMETKQRPYTIVREVYGNLLSDE